MRLIRGITSSIANRKGASDADNNRFIRVSGMDYLHRTDCDTGIAKQEEVKR